ncbi:MAG: twin-arginine translocase subunit TatC [Candidatus Gastranaerophilales bacterium]|nr:twin-arginine translocase subunit TatC [Candidatus Gastranaerophilales bacterium]
MNTQDKDIIDKIDEWLQPFYKYKIRVFSIVLIFFLMWFVGFFFAAFIIKFFESNIPFKINFLQLYPYEMLFNYLKFGFLFSVFVNFPFFVYQFGKMKVNINNLQDKSNLFLLSLILVVSALLSVFLSYKILIPLQLFLLYGLNLNIAEFSVNISSFISTICFNIYLVMLLLLLPVVKQLVKKEVFFNYATLVKYKKQALIALGIIAFFIISPAEIVAFAIVFFIFAVWYKIVIHLSKKRD